MHNRRRRHVLTVTHLGRRRSPTVQVAVKPSASLTLMFVFRVSRRLRLHWYYQCSLVGFSQSLSSRYRMEA